MRPRHLAIPLFLLLVSVALWFAIRPAAPPAFQPEQREVNPSQNYPPPVTGVLPGAAAATPEPPRFATKELPAPLRATPFPTPPRGPILLGSKEPRKQYSRTEIRADLDKAKLLIQQYRSTLGENPVGTNAEIMKALNGGNPSRIRIEPDGSDGASLNGEGELVDRYGNPYFFHQISGQEMEIRSAGPDGKMWTSDDVIIK